MKKIVRGLVAAIGLGIVVVPTAFAGDPCGAVMCLSNGTSNPMQCKDSVDGYFDIRVYWNDRHGRHYDPGATAMKRYREVMDKCSGARQSDKDSVNARFGMLEYSPIGYY